MIELSKKILENYQVRRTKKQKLKFIELMKENYPNLKVEEGGFLHNRNIIIGDVDSAKVVLSAHYDTCAILPFPNFITPKNMFLYLLYSLALVIFLFAPATILYIVLNIITKDPSLSYFISDIFLFIELIFGILIGIPNKHTANDNTSGVITLIEYLNTLTEEERKEVAIVFFDNEENGLFGSMFFDSKHKDVMKNKLLINFDCVSDGDNLLIVQNKKNKNNYNELLKETFVSDGVKDVYIETSKTAFYPSDQMIFKENIAFAFMNKGKFGLYMNKIHTSKDIVFDEKNIEFIVARLKNFIDKI